MKLWRRFREMFRTPTSEESERYFSAKCNAEAGISRMATDATENWLQLRLDYSRSMLDEAHSMPSHVSEQSRQMLALRAAFAAGASLLYCAQRVPSLDSPVPEERDSLAEAPDLTDGHVVLCLGFRALQMTRALQQWDDYDSYARASAGPPFPLDDATMWARNIQDAFKRWYELK